MKGLFCCDSPEPSVKEAASGQEAHTPWFRLPLTPPLVTIHLKLAKRKLHMIFFFFQSFRESFKLRGISLKASPVYPHVI